MPIPTYDKLFRPVLEIAAAGPISRTTATEAMIRQHGLTPEEASQKLPSGSATSIGNRTGWAMTFLTKAGLIQKVAPKMYRATERGASLLTTHQGPIKESDLKAIPGYKEAWEAGSARRREKEALDINFPKLNPDQEQTSTPHEIIAQQVESLQADLRGRLLQAIVDQTPKFFEELVLDVLIAMGYGGSKQDAAEHVGQSGDEGIDGRINQDTLGLDQVLVQAKKYRPDRTVTRADVQGFVGSLSGQGVTKGVFITTSSFVSSAREFVARGLNTKVVLVDGKMLIDLMVRHKIGVRVVKTHEIQEIDQNYFDDEE
jgi:restriction system protein